jgi:hypothetical protein
MRSRQCTGRLGTAGILLLALSLPGGAPAASAGSPSLPAFPAAGRTLRAFAGEGELAALLRSWKEEARRRREAEARRRREAEARAAASGMPPPAPAPEPVAGLADAAADAAGSVTNVQEAGVDEGGIVKLHGDHLMILRRGRLFTVRIGGGALRPVAAVDAFGPQIDPDGTWYDELLIGGDTVAVIGFSYARGGTEVGLFAIGRDGSLRHRATYQLRSNDYYSSRNYASRLIGSRLIFYSPLVLSPWAEDPWAFLPAMRRWRTDGKAEPFRRIAPATRIYRTDAPLDPWRGIALHTVSICDLAKPAMACSSTAVLGPTGSVFYMSREAVYVWTTRGWADRARSRPSDSGLFRIPLSGAPPTALKTQGAPIDQFSFREDGQGRLHVLVRAEGRGAGMWAGERPGGKLALLQVPIAGLGDGSDSAPPEAYLPLPRLEEGALQNRFVGPWLLVGSGTGWEQPRPVKTRAMLAVRVASGAVRSEILDHAVDRIEALGNDAVVVGSDGRDLHFTTLDLATEPRVADRYRRADAAQGETRSHGFFYRATEARQGLLGLPVIGGGEAAAGNLLSPPAGVLFLRNNNLKLSELGTLEARPARESRDDGCRASCVDWYGNARPLFLRDRIFALMGYEIVEGKERGGRITEVRRIDFAPNPGTGRS